MKRTDENFFKFIFNWRIIALQFALVSAIHQHESAIGIDMPLPSWTSLPPHPTPLGCYRALVWVPRVIEQIPTGYLFTRGGVHVSMLLSPLVSLSPSLLCVHKSGLSMSVSPLLPCKWVHLSGFRISVLIYICLSLLTYFILYNRLLVHLPH